MRMMEGECTKQIARSLAIAQSTARTHVQNVLVKLGVHSQLEATTVAAQTGLFGRPAGTPSAHRSRRRAAAADHHVGAAADKSGLAQAARVAHQAAPGRGRSSRLRGGACVQARRRAGSQRGRSHNDRAGAMVLSESPVDVVLIDVDLDGRDGIRFADEVLSENPTCASSSSPQVRTRPGCRGRTRWRIRLGAEGRAGGATAGGGSRCDARGDMDTAPAPHPSSRRADLHTADRTEHELIIATLTRRENEVLCCLASGMSRDAIAGELCLSSNTVRTHIQNLMGKA